MTRLRGSPLQRMLLGPMRASCSNVPFHGWATGTQFVLGSLQQFWAEQYDTSRLDKYGYCFLERAIPMDMLGWVMEEVDTFSMDQWEPIFQKYHGEY